MRTRLLLITLAIVMFTYVLWAGQQLYFCRLIEPCKLFGSFWIFLSLNILVGWVVVVLIVSLIKHADITSSSKGMYIVVIILYLYGLFIGFNNYVRVTDDEVIIRDVISQVDERIFMNDIEEVNRLRDKDIFGRDSYLITLRSGNSFIINNSDAAEYLKESYGV